MEESASSEVRSVRIVTVIILVATALVLAVSGSVRAQANTDSEGTPTYQILRQDVIINADMWDDEPKMMAAGLGFTHIIGVPGLNVNNLQLSEMLAREAGGTWNTLSCAMGVAPSLNAYTSAQTPLAIAIAYGFPVLFDDGLPIEFSWPIRPSTLDATDFLVTLNDGERVVPDVASIAPNLEFNERSVAVVFGKFGNRLPPTNPASVYPIVVEVVADNTPLQLVGPNNLLVSAVGFRARTPGTPYTDPDLPPEQWGGPRIVAAKLTRMSTEGEGAPAPFQGAVPNDGVTLYGSEAQYRLRIYTSGGFSPDGVRGVFPTEFSRYFRLRAKGTQGKTVLLTETGVDYAIHRGTVRVVGLADLGRSATTYDDCYTEDQDNYIDIILAGDERAVRHITHVEIPAIAPYHPFYNPGGPGNDPTPGVRYSAPSPPQVVKVRMALDDPMTVTFVSLPP
jgi:hypothetical protein